MGLLAAEIAWHTVDDLPRDYVENVVFFRETGGQDGILENLGFLPSVAADYNATAQNWAQKLDTWRTTTATGLMAGSLSITIKLYDMADPKPRAPKGSYTLVGSATRANISSGPAEVALCLSYYGTRNLPRQRGRFYCGPLSGSTVSAAQPSTQTCQNLGSLAAVFGGFQVQVPNPGTNTDVDWVIYSRVSNSTHKVTNWWVDNEWDVQRRRRVKATARQTGTVTA